MPRKSKKSILKNLVSELTEVYQPIYTHPELSSKVSRECQDRLEHIVQVYDSLAKVLQRPLHVLDLGSAQGFFSFSLAEIGASVHGVDYLNENVAVCDKLAVEHNNLSVSFQSGRIEDVLQDLEPGQYDLVLGLSVFHHIVQEKGAEFVTQLLGELTNKVEAGIFEFAQSTEPMYWAEAQPVKTRDLLNEFSFVHELSQHKTHLSSVPRPLYFASNNNWFLNNRLGTFKSTRAYSHSFALGVHKGTRHYYFSNEYIVKLYRLDNKDLLYANHTEYLNETTFLTNPPSDFKAPELVLHGENESEAWIVREKLEGEILLDIIRQKKKYDPILILNDVLSQLAVLENVGLFHNDIRVWNVLVNDNTGRATLFDYGAVSNKTGDCVWPHNIFLAFLIFVYEVTTGYIHTPTPIRSPRINPFGLSEPYRKWAISFWSQPVSKWSFNLLHELFVNRDTLSENTQDSDLSIQKWTQAIEEAVDLYFISNRQIQSELNVSQSELEVMKKEAAHLNAHAQQMQNEKNVSESELKAMKKEAAHLNAHAQQMQNEKNVSESELKAMKKEAAHLKYEIQSVYVRESELKAMKKEAAHLKYEIQSVYKSKSWRITWPLRMLSKSIKQIILLPVRLARWFIRKIKDIIKWHLEYVLKYLHKHPKLKYKVAKILIKFPKLNSRLRLFALTSKQKGSSFINPNQESKKLLSVNSLQNFDQNIRKTQFINLENDNQIQISFPLAKGQRKIYYFVDHTILCPVNTGMQRVTRRLARALMKYGETLLFVEWDMQNKKLVLINQTKLSHLSKWDGPVISDDEILKYPVSSDQTVNVETHNLMQANWLMVPEVTHITYQSQPVTLDVIMFAKQNGLKSAFIFYDAIPLKRTEFKDISLTHQNYMQQLLIADLIIPISGWSTNNLVSYWQLNDKASLKTIPKVRSVLLPGESQLTPRVVTVTPLQKKETNKIILTVGTVEPRKNQVGLVKAFDHFCSEHPKNKWKLLVVGNLHPDVADDILRATAKNSQIQHLIATDTELNDYYNNCAFTVFPSVEEGFGLPILESLWYAKPCICANFGAMGEVAKGGGCLTIDTSDPEELYSAIVKLTQDTQLLDKLSLEAIKRPIESWSDYAQHVSSIFDEESNPVNTLGNVYYWVDHTCTYPHNSGIQRVVRGLARSLIDLGLTLIPVKWDGIEKRFYSPTDIELKHLAHWNGPDPSGWSKWVDLGSVSPNDWMLIPELTSYLPSNHISGLKEYLSRSTLRCAWIFYDTIPWKMESIYPIEATEAHAAYMLELNNYERIFPISMSSRIDLIDFLNRTRLHMPNLEERIQSCVLPGEFQGSKRITEIKNTTGEVVNILCVGTVEPRKNHIALLKAFKYVLENTKKKVKLIIAGGAPFPDLEKQINEYIENTPGIYWETKVDDTRLLNLYKECDFTVYPSLEEGFGLPILESLWNGRPCVCNNKGAIQEAASEGGCYMIDVTDVNALVEAMLELVEDKEIRLQRANEAINRPFKTWRDYAFDVATKMAIERHIPIEQSFPATLTRAEFNQQFVNLLPRPVLSICISTYNRAEWLGIGLKYLIELLPVPREEIEIVVCDNTSTDHTPDVVAPYLGRSDFHYHRNPENVGMLGNLRVTAHHALGQYIWILGDDDLIKPGSIEKILEAIRTNPEAALIYLNYAYTHESSAKGVNDLDAFINSATPIVDPTEDISDYIKNISTQSENFFTAIYCLIYRRDHALKAYSLNIEGRPFSTMLTCIPTTYYVLNYMMDEPGVWLGEPLLVVNMNVSWLKYAPLWILERIPEVYDLAERSGVSEEQIDKWRAHTLLGVVHYFRDVFENDPLNNAAYFKPDRVIRRFKHLPEFLTYEPELRDVYKTAYSKGHPAAVKRVSAVFPQKIY
jgi:glycosyltransferase involved in cell wall biosynthesis/SAM-dependent methyltransferase